MAAGLRRIDAHPTMPARRNTADSALLSSKLGSTYQLACRFSRRGRHEARLPGMPRTLCGKVARVSAGPCQSAGHPSGASARARDPARDPARRADVNDIQVSFSNDGVHFAANTPVLRIQRRLPRPGGQLGTSSAAALSVGCSIPDPCGWRERERCEVGSGVGVSRIHNMLRARARVHRTGDSSDTSAGGRRCHTMAQQRASARKRARLPRVDEGARRNPSN